MSSKKTKLELTWIGKEHRPKLEPRILLEEPEKSHHAKFRVREWPQENAKNAKDSDSSRSSAANKGKVSDSKKVLPQENAENTKGSDSLSSLRSFAANDIEPSDSKKVLPQENAENTKNSDSLRSLRSFAATNEVGDIFDNMLIRGDNLLGLKALEQEFAGKVKCIYIDPPYNTGSAFEHYDDGLERYFGIFWILWLVRFGSQLMILRCII